ncbi:MAG: hypothetical protein GXP25_00175 [Planctomycetes bacterium]|nr:hypothetical protein [Planctomycetota bacterium]
MMKVRTSGLLPPILLLGALTIAQEKGPAPRTKVLDGFEGSRSWNLTQKQRNIWANAESAEATAQAEKKLQKILNPYNEFDVRETMARLGPADYEALRGRVADAIVELMTAK